ncbi:MAG: ATP-binding protein [Cellulophaga sp.]
MRKVKNIFKLYPEGLSKRKISSQTSISRNTVSKYIDYDNNRNIDKNQLQRFASCDFIKNKESVLITGSTGVGKSFIASAIGYQACSLSYKVMYFNTHKLLPN